MDIKVYPTKATAVNVKHPDRGALRAGGVMWPQDGFTARMLTDGIATEDAAKAWAPEAPKVVTSPAPQPAPVSAK